MKHSGKARKAAFKIILFTLVTLLVVWGLVAAGALLAALTMAIAPFLLVLWLVFSLFTLYFFRDPTPKCPAGEDIVVSPAHAKVDVIDTVSEPQFMGGECRRISMFLSVLDVHIQNAPVTAKVEYLKYTEGEFMNAMRTECASRNENVLIGFETTRGRKERIGVRLIAGVLARRIVPFVQTGEEVKLGERISLIQFGSRADVYLPMNAQIQVKLGDKVVGGETVLATLV
jgi:phosphatidylserine decarboxylase